MLRLAPCTLLLPPLCGVAVSLAPALGLVYCQTHPSDPAVSPSLSPSHPARVSFRVVVFRPFREELLVGKVHKMTRCVSTVAVAGRRGV